MCAGDGTSGLRLEVVLDLESRVSLKRSVEEDMVCSVEFPWRRGRQRH